MYTEDTKDVLYINFPLYFIASFIINYPKVLSFC